MLGIGDPACDLSVAWALFSGKSREVFRETLQLDSGTWARGRGWALWKALIVAAGLYETNALEAAQCWRVIDAALADAAFDA
jgi:aminoglycoside phosphotransferase (APT) family kinase protein